MITGGWGNKSVMFYLIPAYYTDGSFYRDVRHTRQSHTTSKLDSLEQHLDCSYTAKI